MVPALWLGPRNGWAVSLLLLMVFFMKFFFNVFVICSCRLSRSLLDERECWCWQSIKPKNKVLKKKIREPVLGIYLLRVYLGNGSQTLKQEHMAPRDLTTMTSHTLQSRTMSYHMPSSCIEPRKEKQQNDLLSSCFCCTSLRACSLVALNNFRDAARCEGSN